jgi:ElaB/YqjD/DUF883 family membrane-anchored ribosome-binding protein
MAMTAQEASERIERTIPILDRPEVKEQVERVRGLVEDVDGRVRNVVQDRPLVAVGAALAFGYLMGRLLARR